jgi:hypothetical protein
MTMSIEEFIEHHGVKGMRWGQRTSRSSVSKSKPTARTKFEKSPSRLSDADLNRRVKRMEVEKRYNDLNKKDVGEGHKFASDILKSTGKTVATTLLAGAALYGISKALNTKMGPGVAEGITGKKIKGSGDANLFGKASSALPPPLPGTKKD